MSAASSASSLIASSTASTTSTQSKDFEAAFAALQSSYGLGGGLAPSVSSKKSKSKAPKSTLAPRAACAPPPSSAAGMNYAFAFRDLSSQFGFGSIAPAAAKAPHL